MTIEERAEAIYRGNSIEQDAYINGAIDQRVIDLTNHRKIKTRIKAKIIDRACEWLKRELADPMPEELYNQWCEEKLADFRKAMADSK